MTARIARWSALAAVLAAGGCAEKGPPRYNVSGTVTYAGQPVVFGRISFAPDLGRGNDGPAGYATITDGRYDTAGSGEATPGGPVMVRINGYGPPDAKYVYGKPLFVEYMTTAELPKGVGKVDFNVPASAAIKLSDTRNEATP